MSLILSAILVKKLNTIIPGIGDTWNALIGALFGGLCTLIGVKLTLDQQIKSDSEKNRLENLPILKFDIQVETLTDYCDDGIYTLNGNEFYTSGFPKDADEFYPVINISLANDKPAFDVYIESCITIEHSAEIVKSAYYAPEKYRLVADETLRHMFWIQDYMKYTYANVLGLLRVAYSDVFGNCYYQDIKFCYNKAIQQIDKIMEFDSIKAPVLKDDALPLFKLMKNEYPEHLNNKTK